MSKETGFAHEFYVSQAWIRCRRDYARSKGLVCERCGAAGTQVHHKTRLTPENIRDPKVTLGWDNLELLCDECHRHEHRGQSGRRWTCDERGRVAIAPKGAQGHRGPANSGCASEKERRARIWFFGK